MNIAQALQWKHPNSQAVCNLENNTIIDWRGPGNKPDEQSLLTEYQNYLSTPEYQDDELEENLKQDDRFLKLARIAFDQENRIRALEGRTLVTFRQFIRYARGL